MLHAQQQKKEQIPKFKSSLLNQNLRKQTLHANILLKTDADSQKDAGININLLRKPKEKKTTTPNSQYKSMDKCKINKIKKKNLIALSAPKS